MNPFLKAHANGNSFLLLEEAHAQGNHATLAHQLCARIYKSDQYTAQH